MLLDQIRSSNPRINLAALSKPEDNRLLVFNSAKLSQLRTEITTVSAELRECDSMIEEIAVEYEKVIEKLKAAIQGMIN